MHGTHTIAIAANDINPAHCAMTHCDNCSLVIRRLTLPPGGSTGWHYHPGYVFAIVEEGTLLHYGPTGELHTYQPGDTFIDPAGPAYVHCATSRPDHPVRLLTLSITPAGQDPTIPTQPPQGLPPE
uniref:Cupin domain-containing protein n=1 Tax=Streptomyces sp. NBC_00003 TaxID=2903608 RepID=A0AAU2VF55_9ACTN